MSGAVDWWNNEADRIPHKACMGNGQLWQFQCLWEPTHHGINASWRQAEAEALS